jgi:hypothetical protein
MVRRKMKEVLTKVLVGNGEEWEEVVVGEVEEEQEEEKIYEINSFPLQPHPLPAIPSSSGFSFSFF